MAGAAKTVKKVITTKSTGETVQGQHEFPESLITSPSHWVTNYLVITEVDPTRECLRYILWILLIADFKWAGLALLVKNGNLHPCNFSRAIWKSWKDWDDSSWLGYVACKSTNLFVHNQPTHLILGLYKTYKPPKFFVPVKFRKRYLALIWHRCFHIGLSRARRKCTLHHFWWC